MDYTKNYMYVFLLAGIEVVISALVLAICNFLCIKMKKEEASEAAAEAGETKVKNQSSKSPTEEPHNANGNAKMEMEKQMDLSDLTPENAKVDPREVETFLKDKNEQNISCSPDTDP